MKRTQIDTEWISVGELVRRASGPKIFLSPIVVPAPPGPPGLVRRLENLNHPLLHQRDSSPFSSPHQPMPIRSLRTPTLDSYINGKSQSASPSSSAGPANHIFGSPELSINTIGANRRPYIDTSTDGLGRSPYPNATINYGFSGRFSLSVSGVLLTVSPRCSSRKYSRASPAIVSHESITLCPLLPDQSSSGPGSYQPELSFSTSTGVGQSPFFTCNPSSAAPPNHPTNVVRPTPPSVPHSPAHNYTPSASPWGTPDLSSLKRVGVFDPPLQSPRHPNTLAQPQQPSPWDRTVRTPWSTVPPEHSSDGWSTGDGTSSLTVSNLEQHNQQQLRPEPTLPTLPEAVSVTTESNLQTPGAPQQDTHTVPTAGRTTRMKLLNLRLLNLARNLRPHKGNGFPTPTTAAGSTANAALTSSKPQVPSVICSFPNCQDCLVQGRRWEEAFWCIDWVPRNSRS
jgi:hypothetical protein